MTWILTAALSNAAVVALLAAPVWLVTHWARQPALTHALWVLLLVKLVTPPLVAVPLPWQVTVAEPELAALLGYTPVQRTADALSSADFDQSIAPESITDRELTNSPSPSASSTVVDKHAGTVLPTAMEQQRLPSARQGLLALIAIWFSGSMLLMFGVVRHILRFGRQVTDELCDQTVAADVKELCEELELGSSPRVMSTSSVVSPMLWGAGPFVWLVFPLGLCQRISAEERRTLLIHELAHFHRRDPWVRWLELVCGIVFWWHPVVWFARREIEAAGEECCDALVVQWSGAPRTYAHAIVSTLDFISERPVCMPPLSSGVSPVPAIQNRLTHIMRQTVAARLSRGARRLVQLACIATMLVHPFIPLIPAATFDLVGKAPAAPREQMAIRPPLPLQDVTEGTKVDKESQPNASAAPLFETLPERPTGWWSPNDNRTWASATAPDGRSRLVADAGRHVRLESLESDDQFDLSDATISCAAYLPSSDRFVTGSAEGRVQLWDAQRGEAVSLLGRIPSEIKSVAADPNGRFVASGTAAGAVLVWELSSGVIVASWTSPREQPVTSVRYSPDGTSLAAAISDWRDPSGSAVLILSAEDLLPITSIEVPGSIAAVRYDSHDTVRIVSWDGRIYGWNPAWRMIQWTASTSRALAAAAAFSPNSVL